MDSASREDKRFSEQNGLSESEENFIVKSGLRDVLKDNDTYIKLLEKLKEMDMYSFIDALCVWGGNKSTHTKRSAIAAAIRSHLAQDHLYVLL